MPIYSGNIGEMIEFDVLNAGTTTGVKFGYGAISKKFKVQNESAILARVSDDATWGQVAFYKTPQNNLYNVNGSGYANSGALNDLQNQLSSLGLYSSNCTSGDVSYVNTYQATPVCDLKATGNSKTEVSGVVYSAYGSGWCGDNTNGFTSSGYSAATTRLNNFSTFQNQSGNWLALGFVENTGDFAYKTANLEVSCVEPMVESTSYKFVPIPLISNFTPTEGKQGTNLKIDGFGFSGVSNVAINSVNVSHQVINSSYISGTVPAGSFEHKIELTAPSGIKSYSLNNFISFEGLSAISESLDMKIISGQSITINQGQQENVNIFGTNISGITFANLTDQNGFHTTINSDPSFSYASDHVSFSPKNLSVGVYDIYLANNLNNTTSNDVLNVLGVPSFSYSYQTVSTNNLINEPHIYADRQSLESLLAESTYNFSITGQAEKLCLSFNNGSVSGSASYELQKFTKGRGVGTKLNRYYIIGSGDTIAESAAKAQEKWTNGVYTKDEFGYPFDASYIMSNCVCNIEESGNALYGLTSEALYATLTATGIAKTGDHDAVKLANENNINQQLTNNYLGYSLSSSITHGYSHNSIPYSFGSGISYPFAKSILDDCDHEFWTPLYKSGSAELQPAWLASSGCGYTNSSTFTFNTMLSGIGIDEGAARGNVNTQKDMNYFPCETGDYNASTITITETITRSGTTYGYC